MVQQRQNRIKNRPARQFEIHINPLGASRRQLRRHIGRGAVNAGVKAQLLHHIGAFVRTPRQPDRPRPANPRNLPHQRTNRARGCTNHHRLPRLGPPDMLQPGVSRHPRHPHHPQRRLHRRCQGVQFPHLTALADHVVPPQVMHRHDIPRLKPLVLRHQNPRHRLGRQRLPQRRRRRIRRPLRHPPPHIGVQRQPHHLQQNLPRPRVAQHRALHPEIGGLWAATRPCGQNDGAGGDGHGQTSLCHSTPTCAQHPA